MKASDIMTFGVATVPAGASLGDAARTLLNHRIRSLPVVDPDGKLVGILSESDLVRALASDQEWISSLDAERPGHPSVLAGKSVSDFMSPVVMTIEGETPAGEAIQIIAERKLHHLPLVEGARPRGMISPTDILRIALDPDR